jgi:hypothetical protein
MRQESFESGRPWLPYPPGRGTAGSTRICVGDTCSSEIVNDPRTSKDLRAQAVIRAFGEPSSASSIQPPTFSGALPSAEAGAILTLTIMQPRRGQQAAARDVDLDGLRAASIDAVA